ncbi:MAG: hypothetical protein P4L90_06285 [Rhodopila sp.]|nr:hypothetical protein [Rhodopila sp.]
MGLRGADDLGFRLAFFRFGRFYGDDANNGRRDLRDHRGDWIGLRVGMRQQRRDWDKQKYKNDRQDVA